MGLHNELPSGATPLDANELDGLIPTHLVNRRQLNELEQQNQKVAPVDRIVIGFHHRLVAIHPFPNGNGRQARLITDVLIQQLGEQLFCWGGRSPLIEPTKLRSEYIEALRFADRGNLEPLWTFARQG